MTTVYVCMYDLQKFDGHMHCTSGDAGITASYSFNTPHPTNPIAVHSYSSRANRANLVVLQGRITGHQRSPPVYETATKLPTCTLSTARTHMLNVHLYTRQHTEIQYSLKYTSLTSALLHLSVNRQRSILRPIVLVSLYILLLSLLGQLPVTNDGNAL
jgi:hypothetical protein